MRRRGLWGGLAVLVLGLVVAAGWLGVHAERAQRSLERVRATLTVVRADLLHGDESAARTGITEIQGWAGQARADTRGPLWYAAAVLPFLGSSVRSAAGVAEQVDRIAYGALPDLAGAATGLTPGSLHLVDGTVDIAPLQQASPALTKAAGELDAARAAVAALPASTPVQRIDHARATLLAELTRLDAVVHDASVAARVAPAMLGADGPRDYFVAFETNAEARGLGGLPGAFAILHADAGHLSVTRLNSDLHLPTPQGPAIELGPEFDNRYAAFGSTMSWQNSDMSPDFPTVSRIWLAMWQRWEGVHLDGAITVDPQVLADILAVTGPVVLPDGEILDAGNAVELTEQANYARFAASDVVRKDYLLTAARAVLNRLLHGPAPDAVSLGRALANDVGERRLLIDSAVPAEEQVLATTPIAGALPTTTGPFLGIAVNNATGGKLDYYVTEQVGWDRGGCHAGHQTQTVNLQFANGAPVSGLPLIAQQHLPGPGHYPPDMERLYVSVYTERGTRGIGVTVNGGSADFYYDTERGFPIYTVILDIDPGQTVTAALRLSAPSATGAVTTFLSPMVRPGQLTVTGSSCHG